MFTKLDKFLVAAIGGAIAIGLVPSGLAQDVVGAITAVLVYLVPNQ